MRCRAAVLVVVFLVSTLGVTAPAVAQSPAAPGGAGMPQSAVPNVDRPLASYEPLSPARVLDTRAGGSTVDGLFAGGGAVGAGATSEVVVTGRGGVPVSGVGAVVLNVTVTGGSAASHVTVFPSGEGAPNASNLNFAAGQTVPNLVIAKVGAGGKVSIRNNSGSTHLIADVAGWLHTGTNQLNPAAILVDRSAYSKVSTNAVSGVSTFTYTGAERLRVGSVLIGKGSVTPTVLETEFWRVTKPDDTATGVRTFEASPGTLRDAYPTLDLHVTADSNAALPRATTRNGEPVPGVSVTVGSPASTQTKAVACEGEINPIVDFDIDSSLGQFNSTLEWGWFEVDAVGFSWTPQGKASHTAGLDAEGSCRLDKQIFNAILPPITFAIGPVPVVITQNLTGTVKGSISGHGVAQFTNTAEFSGKYGFLWTDDTGFALIDEIVTKPSIVPQLSVEVDASVGFEARYYLAAYGVVGITMSLTPYVGMEASAELKGLPPDTVWWIDGSLRAGVKAGLGIGLPLIGESWEPLVLDIYKDFPFSVRPAVPPAPDLYGATSVSLGVDHSCARLGDSTVRCWGANDKGQVGDGTTTERRAPVVVALLSGATDITAGFEHTCAIGQLYRTGTPADLACWGGNAKGELGLAEDPPGCEIACIPATAVRPTAVEGYLDRSAVSAPVDVDAGSEQTCATARTFVVPTGASANTRCWGEYGQWGLAQANQAQLVDQGSMPGAAAAVSTGLSHSCVLSSTATLWCFGRNLHGQLGIGTEDLSISLQQVSGLTAVTAAAAGADHSCAVAALGRVWCWGRNVSGQLGNLSTVGATSPTLVKTPSG
jgi:hypothetical protein